MLVALLLMSACSRNDTFSLPPPPTTVPPTSTTASPDFSQTDLPRVPGRTTTTVPLQPGMANIQGAVTGPDGPVGGATVQLERLVGDGVGTAILTTQPDGTWTAAGILGGRYRVRAWLAPDLAQAKPSIFFLTSAEAKQLSLTVARYDGLAVASAVAPSPPQVGQAISLVVAVTNRSVDGSGVVRAAPVTRVSVELTGGPGWRLDSANPTTTDGNGQARWVLRCQRTGPQALGVIVGGTNTFALDLPACDPAPPTTTSTTRASTTSTTSGSTSTTS